MRVKVLITVPCVDLPGGVANYYAVLRRFLDPDIEYFEIGSRDERHGIIRTAGRLISDWWRFHQLIKAGQYDLVHINPTLGMKSVMRDGILLYLAAWYGTKTVVFFRGWDPACEATIRQNFFRIFRYVFGKADAFILLGSDFEKKIRSFGIYKPVFLETTLVDDAVFSLTESGKLIHDKHGSQTEILFLSRLDHGKGLLESLEAFRQLRKTWPEVRLTVAGDGPVRAEAEQFVQNKGIEGVRFAGHVSGHEKNLIFVRADVYLFTSFHEGMPNSVLEAMAFGLPVVTSSVGGLKDFFEEDLMGCIVDPRDPVNICTALATLLTNPESGARMGMFNRQYARKRFSASVVAKRLVSIYENVINFS